VTTSSRRRSPWGAWAGSAPPGLSLLLQVLRPPPRRVHLTVGNRSGYRGNRSYRYGSVRKKLGYRSLTESSKPLFSVYRSVLPIYRTGFGGLVNRSGSGFLNPASTALAATPPARPPAPYTPPLAPLPTGPSGGGGGRVGVGDWRHRLRSCLRRHERHLRSHRLASPSRCASTTAVPGLSHHHRRLRRSPLLRQGHLHRRWCPPLRRGHHRRRLDRRVPVSPRRSTTRRSFTGTLVTLTLW
jgi:hypothetical protein